MGSRVSPPGEVTHFLPESKDADFFSRRRGGPQPVRAVAGGERDSKMIRHIEKAEVGRYGKTLPIR